MWYVWCLVGSVHVGYLVVYTYNKYIQPLVGSVEECPEWSVLCLVQCLVGFVVSVGACRVSSGECRVYCGQCMASSGVCGVPGLVYMLSGVNIVCLAGL